MDGRCLCGTVRWRIGGELGPLSHCHCSMCRKTHGTAFGTYAAVDPQSLAWTAGEDAVSRYESSPGFYRAFCRHCGSTVPGTAPDGHRFAPAGGLESDPGARPRSHIYVASKAPWYAIRDDLRRFDAYPGQDGDAVARPPPARSGRAGVVAGSCLCRDVAFEVRAPFTAAYHCHCSRCRRGRAAAHATNGVSTAEGVVLVRGEDAVASYRLPEARHFTQAFCRRCGSKLPVRYPERGIAVVPLGALDDDPGRAPDAHIFVGSKAPWFPIADDLPRHEERPES